MLVSATLTWLSVILFMLDVLSSNSEWQRKVFQLSIVGESGSSGFHLDETSRGRGCGGYHATCVSEVRSHWAGAIKP